MKKSVTLYDDQYKFFKELKSEKLMIAFIEFMFENIEPEGLNSLEQTIFDSLRVRMNNQKQKARAGAKGGASSHGGGRPPKQAKEKEKTSKKQAEKQAKNKEDKEISKDILRDISNDISKVEDKVKEKEKKEKFETSSNDSFSFENFWKLYPCKNDKKKAKQKFDRLSLIKKQLAIEGISKLKESDKWKKGFIPNPTTYLNGERWEDEVESKATEVKKIQDYQQQMRLEEARKILNPTKEKNDEDQTTSANRRREIFSL